MANKGLRFAALIRVSTEQQQKTGESLKTQRTQIEKAVRELGGNVVGWYGGQEHATPGGEKREIERLLSDASKERKTFDAVMVTHADRWSRDNEASTRGLKRLKDNQIKFFTLSQDHDLYDPTVEMFLGISAVIGAYQAKLQKKKSMESRIHRAGRGFQTAGKLPYGRTCDRLTGKWGIDREKRNVVEDVARRYLKGESMAALAKEYDMNHSTLHKIMTRRCGTKWEQTFQSKDLDIDKTVEIGIPALLPTATIKKILAKVAANKTYEHGQLKRNWLLSRMIFCEECGVAYSGQMNFGRHKVDGEKGGRGYYRHRRGADHAKTCAVKQGWVRSDELEDAVLRQLFNAFGNPAEIERAIEKAIPDLDAQRQNEERVEKLVNLIKKKTAGRQSLLRQILDGNCPEHAVKDLLTTANNELSQLEVELEQLQAKTTPLPTKDEILDVAKAFGSRFRPRSIHKRASPAEVKLNATTGVDFGDFEKLSWADKRILMQRVFAGLTPDRKRAGVYVEWRKGKGTPCWYHIRGLIERNGKLPMDDRSKEYLVNPDHIQVDEQRAVTKYASHSPAPTPPAPPSPQSPAPPPT